MSVPARKWLDRLLPLVGLALFATALWVLSRELRGFRYADLAAFLRQLPPSRVALALALTGLSYLLLVGYDTLALIYVGQRLPAHQVALSSFISYAFSASLGNVLVVGGAVRYRLYSYWGVSPTAIGRVIVFASVTFWLGLCALGGVALVATPGGFPPGLHLPLSARQLGAALLLAALLYLAWAGLLRRPLRLGCWSLPPPTPVVAGAQLVGSCVDLLLAASVLWVLLPPSSEVSFFHLLAAYLAALVAGLASQVPGGLGVFETVVVLLLPQLPASSVLAALLAYRAVYYLLPLLAATILFALREIRHRPETVAVVARALAAWTPRLVPRLLAAATFAGGVVLLFSLATPAVGSRLAWLGSAVPLPFIELSHFLGSVAGVGLLFLAVGMHRRLDAAYVAAVALLAAGIVASLLQGLDWEEAAILAVLLLALLPCHGYFYRRSSLLAEPLSRDGLLAVGLALTSTLWLGLFAYRHVDYSSELWWRFTLDGEAPRFLRATVGMAGAAMVVGLARLLRTAPPDPAPPTADDLAAAYAIAAAHPDPTAYLALLGDKTLLFNAERTAFVMYAVQGRSWISMGDPVGEPAQHEELVWAFKAASDRHGAWPVFYEVQPSSLPLYLDLGLELLKLGEAARVPLAGFSLAGSARRGLRYTVRKVEEEGGSFEVVERAAVPALLPELRAVSDAWLANKHSREKGFSLGTFDERYLQFLPVALLRLEGRIVAFANLWPGGGRQQLGIDLMRHTDGAPHGAMEYLFARLMLWGREQGYAHFSLGMAPLAGIEGGELAPLASRVGAFLYRHGEHFYNFQGLRRFKDKFDPVWEPRYLAYPGRLVLPRILADLAALISGGIQGMVTK